MLSHLEVSMGNKPKGQVRERRPLSVDIDTYNKLKQIAARNLRPMSSQIRFYVEQDMQRGQVHDQPETVQTAR